MLDWLNRGAARVPYRVLEPVSEHGESGSDNLDALLPFYCSRVKCVFIDSPYKTKSALTHYDDNLERSQ